MNLQEQSNRIKQMMGLVSEELEEDKESGEKWVKCRNCRKKFTQTIHKGKKSSPICPHCGTHNDSLKESSVPISIRRRTDMETLRNYITLGELNYPTLCDDFVDEYEYSDHVIDYALDEFLSEHKIDIEDEDYYSNVMDYFRNLCRELFGEYLYDIYKTTCSEYNLTEEIVEEYDDTISSDTIIDFERILNKKMPKKFPWWKQIDIQSMGYQPTIFSGMGGTGQTILYGDLFVDEDWARKKWEDLHSSSTVNFPDTNNLEFNDLLGYDEWMELIQYVGKLYNSLTGRNAERISLNRLNVYFDVPQLPQIKEGLHDTSWENEEGDKVTLIDLLKATEDLPIRKISVEKLKPKLLSWDGDEDEISKIEKADLQYPILILVDDNNKFVSIIDGHHRAQKAVRHKLKTIDAKIIPTSLLPKSIRKVFGHLHKGEQNESELTERCWKGYTQKGMKTMFGKRYPNCVKKKKR